MNTENHPNGAVYTSLHSVMAALARDGIAKSRRNDAQKFNFRGIDDIYKALAPLLVENQLLIIPHVTDREMNVVAGKGDKSDRIYCYVDVGYEFRSVKDGSSTTARFCGEGMDNGDKALAKALSSAYKAMAIETFCIPVEGDDDADAEPIAPGRINAVCVELKACKTKDALKACWDAASDEARKAGDGNAHAVWKNCATEASKGINEFMPAEAAAKQGVTDVDPDTGEVIAPVKADATNGPVTAEVITNGMLSSLLSTMKRKGRTEADFSAHFKADLGDFPKSRINEAMTWAKS